jgi:hypothetical protein
LSQRLRDLGCEVHATSRWEKPTRPAGPVWWRFDTAHLEDARSLFAKVKPDIVFHLAGSVGAAVDCELVLTTYHSLLTSTVNMLAAATEFGCRRIILAGCVQQKRDVLGLRPLAQTFELGRLSKGIPQAFVFQRREAKGIRPGADLNIGTPKSRPRFGYVSDWRGPCNATSLCCEC